MKNGTHNIYVLEHRRTHKTPWLKPNGKLLPCEDKEWARSNSDYFREAALSKKKQARRRQTNHNHMVWQDTGFSWGWYDLRMAKQMLDNVQRADFRGDYNSKDTYGTITQAVRYEFRLVYICISKTTSLVK